VPGNHDVYTSGSHRARRFASRFGAYTTSDLPVREGEAFPFVRLRDRVAFVGLSSAVPRLPFVSAGKVGDGQLGSLRTALDDPRVRERFVFVMLHHPPIFPASAWKTHMEGLRDAPALADVLSPVAHGLVAHGHLHRRVHRQLGRLDVFGATSSSLLSASPERMAGWNVYEVEEGRLHRAYAQVWDPAHRSFSEREIPQG
jgi:3',5'-cyclic AMP phosphodiesterase CpdA